MQSEDGNVKRQKNNLYLKRFLQSPIAGAVIAFALVFAVMAITGEKTFLSGNNMMNIIRQGAVLSIVDLCHCQRRD